MAELTELTNALATHEQIVNEFLRFVENLVAQLRADVAALQSQLAAGDPGAEQALAALRNRLIASTANLEEAKTRLV